MATYAIGDIQGCFEPLTRLLAAIDFEPRRDRLWLVGDVVNRGPDSLAVLRWARGLGEAIVMVLGNHELHLLGIAAGVRRSGARDTLAPVLDAPDRDLLLDWLACRPLVARADGRVLVHAGVHPAWSADEAEARAGELAESLQARRLATLAALVGETPSTWSNALGGPARLRAIAAVLTRMRVLDTAGRLDLRFTGPPGAAPAGTLPWFRIAGRRTAADTIIFGHWAALGLVREPGLFGLDTGCVWGHRLTAVRLDDGAIVSVPARPAAGGEP